MKLLKDLGTLYPTPTSKNRRRYGLYECPICFKAFEAQTDNVKTGKSTKCKSCAVTIANTTHGESNTPLHHVYTSMINRCEKTYDSSYDRYGAKGVTVCAEWKESYETFRDWALANGYRKGLAIDKDRLCDLYKLEYKIYSPGTCEWVTAKENSHRSSTRVHKNGNTKISIDDASYLCEAYNTGLFTYKELAEALPYKVTACAVSIVIRASLIR